MYRESKNILTHDERGNELFDDLDFYDTEEMNKASICYIIFLSPLLLVSVYSLLSSFLSLMFFDETIVFFREYLKVFILIPVFLIVLVGILPFLIFKLFFPKEKIAMKIFTYSIVVSLVFPTLILPKAIHHLYSEPINIEAKIIKIYNNSHKSKNNSITFSSKKRDFNTIEFSHLPRTLLNQAKIGDTYMINGRKSKFYFKYHQITKK